MRHAVPSRRAESRQLRGACVDSIRAAASAVFLRRSTPYAPPRSPGGGIRADTVVEVDDFAQRFEVKIIVQHKEDWDEEKDPDGYTLKVRHRHLVDRGHCVVNPKPVDCSNVSSLE